MDSSAIAVQTLPLEGELVAVDQALLPIAPELTVPIERHGPAVVVRAAALVGAVAVYAVYRHLRVGAGRGVFRRGLPVEPFDHAMTVLAIEQALWIDIEQGVQNAFLRFDAFIRFCNAYYSWSHQIVTLGLVAAVVLMARWSDAKRWVLALLAQLPIGLAMFAVYPLMPPRLLDAGPPWGGRMVQVEGGLRPTGIVDTLAQYRGPWTPEPAAVSSFTNQFAAMPSLHCAFSMWVAVVWWQWAANSRWRVLGALHAAFVFFCTVVTGNHFVLDAVIGRMIAIAALVLTNRTGVVRRTLRAYRAQRSSNRIEPNVIVSQ